MTPLLPPPAGRPTRDLSSSAGVDPGAIHTLVAQEAGHPVQAHPGVQLDLESSVKTLSAQMIVCGEGGPKTKKPIVDETELLPRPVIDRPYTSARGPSPSTQSI